MEPNSIEPVRKRVAREIRSVVGAGSDLVVLVVSTEAHAIECNDAIRVRGRGYGLRFGAPGGRPDSFRTLFAVLSPPNDARDWTALTDAALPVDALHAWATTPRSGAVVCFLGVVRDHAEGREGVSAMTYEAYEEPARRVMVEIVAEARRRWTALERVALLHRVGELALSEPSVAVAVSSPHRDDAFEAARYCIDTLKEAVPIWKQEHWTDGSDWALGEHPIRPVAEPKIAASAAQRGEG